MKPEIVTIDNDEDADPPPFQEVEFALILAQMINTVKQDPTQLRFAVYEFARSKLAHNLPDADEAERKRLQSALEVAIKGVEQFSQRTDQEQRLLPAPPPSTALTVGPDVPARSSQVTVISPDRRDYTEAEWKPLPSRFGERRRTFRRWRATSIAAGVLIAAGLAEPADAAKDNADAPGTGRQRTAARNKSRRAPGDASVSDSQRLRNLRLEQRQAQ